MAESQGARSASVNGIPWLIFSTFAREWSESPSRYGQRIASANILPSVVFPEPATPISTTITDIALQEFAVPDARAKYSMAGADLDPGKPPTPQPPLEFLSTIL